MENYRVRSPVLFLIFNRPDLASEVFAQIRKVKPSRLYIAADGPRPDRPDDEALCRQSREIVKSVDWECSINTRFLDENLGCRLAVSGAVTWFFEHEAEGIILEDDCLPSISFFSFCDELLDKFRDNDHIVSITGTNLQLGQRWGSASYYFSQYANVWGWASWRRVWNKYDVSLRQYNEEFARAQLKQVLEDDFLVSDWLEFFRDIKANKIDTWDYQLIMTSFFQRGLCVTPNVNLISNIGFREDATHTPNPLNHNANLPRGEIDEIIHNDKLVPQKAADYFFLNKEYNLEHRWAKYKKDQLPRRRFKRWLKGLWKKNDA